MAHGLPSKVQMAENNSAVSLLNQGLVCEALKAFDALAQECPGYWAAHFNRGNALKDMKRWKEAITAYDRALELAAEPPWLGILPKKIVSQIRCNRGGALLDCGLLDSARKAFESALEADPANMIARMNLENMQRSVEDGFNTPDDIGGSQKKWWKFWR